jgi:3-phosphoshikimate 1-carboxyvinyltransferase
MGADLQITRRPSSGSEPAGDIRVRYSGRLQAIELPEQWVPSMVDEIPVLMVLAAVAKGTSRIRGASELRVKESDRLAVMGDGLRCVGIEVTDYDDGVDICGSDLLRDQTVESAGDHRCAMSFAVLALRTPGGLRIRNAEYIATSYPGFIDDMNSLGAHMHMVDTA